MTANIRIFLLLALMVCVSMSAGPAAAEDVLSLGIFPRRSAEQTIRMHTPLAEYLSEKLGQRVVIRTARDFDTFWKHVADRRFHIVHYNPYDYVRSAREHGYRAILKNEEDGQTTLAGAIFVRKDSGIKDLRGLKGKRITFGGGSSAMFSYLLPSYLLRRNGLGERDYVREFAPSPPHALFAVYYGHADAAGAGEIVPEFEHVRKKIDVTRLRTLAVSAKLTQLPWAVRSDVDPTLEKRIQAALSGLQASERGRQVLRAAGLTGLHASSDEEYDEHRKIIWHVRGEDYCLRQCDYVGRSGAAKDLRQ